MKLTEKQQKLKVHMQNEIGQITNRYIKGEERSFTIIAYPVPAIGDQFEEIFRETVKINTLDYNLYQQIQQKLIDALDLGTSVHILGKGENRTDLRVQLHKLEDPEKQTNFENCLADVNIPVGEVFTSPKLTGTNGVLHVTQVYLNELRYENLEFPLRMVWLPLIPAPIMKRKRKEENISRKTFFITVKHCQLASCHWYEYDSLCDGKKVWH